MQHQARRCGLAGWVRNVPDGRVEFAAQGEAEAVQQLLDWARQGPPGARVEGLDLSEVDPAESPGDFEIRF
jgi:acylphosphatase